MVVVDNDIDYRYNYCTTFEEVKTLVRYCKQTGYCCNDFETNAEHYTEPTAYPTILSISFQPGSAWVVPLGHADSPFKHNWLKVLKYIGRELISNPNIIKIAQNLKFEYNWWRKYDIIMSGRLFDTMLAKYLLDEERPHGLKEMVAMFIPQFTGYDLKGQPGDKASREKIVQFWTNVPIMKLSVYGALDADLTFRLMVFFENRIFSNGFQPLLRNLLMMSTRVLADTEWNGMYTDKEYLRKLLIVYRDKIIDCEYKLNNLPEIVLYNEQKSNVVKRALISATKKEIKVLKKSGGSDRMIQNRNEKISRYLAGEFTTNKERKLVEPLNFGSPAQLRDLFFYSESGFGWDVVSYTIDKKNKRETDTASVGEDILKILNTKYRHPVINTLIELRKLSKMNSTYVVAMWEKLHSNNRIHGSFLLHGTVTGRLSSRNPNLQNIPRDTTAKDIKMMFIHPPGKLILQLDYSQAELRVLAYLAKEETMLHWFKVGHDIHLATACKKYNVDYKDIAPIMGDEKHRDYTLWKIRRKQAKTTNFGIAYEQGPGKLAEKLTEQGVPTNKEEAKIILDEWFKDFPKVKTFISKQHKLVKKKGYVANLFGRKRRLAASLESGNRFQEMEAYRQSVNSPIQGSASDFALFSSVLIRDAILRGELPSDLEQFGTVHDSLLYYIKPEDIHEAVPILARICANPETKEWFNFEITGVEMKADFEIGLNWSELKGYNPQEDYTKWLK
jgi:DNA polymerase I-like protein with 3'-5' exonuclease and polymerase domains